MIDDHEELKSMAVQYFANLFTGSTDQYIPFPFKGMFPQLDIATSTLLAKEITNDEVRMALFDLQPLKSPGVDGLHALFLQNQWSTVGPKICDFIKGIFSGQEFPREINRTLITLIPKCENPESIKSFRPISLCNVIYKIITKIIANRLKKVMPHIIGPMQTSFVEGRHITDKIILAQEALHSMRKKKGKKSFMVIKIDLEKAYDRISWDFLSETLEDIGFPTFMSKVIMSCVSTVSMNILWNSSLLDEFYPTCGIRQGDPISPYLFVLCVERLSHLINKACSNKQWKPLSMGRHCPGLSHLFFADDLLLFSEASYEQVEIINSILDTFRSSAGQRVNKDKTKVHFSTNVPNATKNALDHNLGFQATEDLGTYLGVPLIHGRYSKRHCTGVMESIMTRLSSWNARSLSLAGRSTLIKSVISSIPIYTMQTASLPRGSCNLIDKSCRRFLWGSTSDNRKINLVKWDVVNRPKMEGGLGHKNILAMNEALLMKIGWNLVANRDVFLVNLLRCKYKLSDNMAPELSNTGGASHLWRSVGKVWKKIQEGVRWALCDGSIIRFWLDPWLGDNNILIDIAASQVPIDMLNYTVNYFVNSNGGWDWEKFAPFIPARWVMKIANVIPPHHSNGVDFLYWGLSSSGHFTTKSAYSFSTQDNMAINGVNWTAVWKWTGPEKIRYFLWFAKLSKILTNEERAKRHISADSGCPRCFKDVETCSHALRDCEFSSLIWNRFLNPDKKVSFFSMNYDVWLDNNLQGHFNGNGKENWTITFGVILWSCWKWRNNFIFADNRESFHSVVKGVDSMEQYISLAKNSRIMQMRGVNCYKKLPIHWYCPNPGWTKINTDGSFNAQSHIAKAGGLARNESGGWIGSFSMCIGKDSVLGAEFRGVYFGLLLGWNLGVRKVIMEVDNKQVVDKINSASSAAEFSNILAAIRGLLARDWTVIITHVYREANFAADHLASLVPDSVLWWAAAEEIEKLNHIEVIFVQVNSLFSASNVYTPCNKFVDILDNPGSADLSTYLDFASVRHSAEDASEDNSVHGQMTLSQFLGSLGINFRVEALLQNCKDEQAESLRTGYWRLVEWRKDEDNAKTIEQLDVTVEGLTDNERLERVMILKGCRGVIEGGRLYMDADRVNIEADGVDVVEEWVSDNVVIDGVEEGVNDNVGGEGGRLTSFYGVVEDWNGLKENVDERVNAEDAQILRKIDKYPTCVFVGDNFISEIFIEDDLVFGISDFVWLEGFAVEIVNDDASTGSRSRSRYASVAPNEGIQRPTAATKNAKRKKK
ncbi:uncharacterized protein LOC126672148 [Mercurialis annua]|uniref:uncharacterized protein LOC126672148 n=1 Tax=Mercurialis annua TaxID=3986 RepID=UPI0024AD0098|nr:uncharacterized protein LOC126672148 [Mercurialis annua]